MTRLLYIGNRLHQSKANLSAIDVLGPLLEGEGHVIYYASSKRNKFLRIWDMLRSVAKYWRQVDCVLIDTYSTQNFYYAFMVSQCCRVLKVPYIPILHGGHLERRLKHSPIMSRLVFNHSVVNITPSNYLKSVFERYGHTNLKFIPNTLQIEQYPYLQKDYQSIRLLWVRSFSSLYNPSMAVNVLKTIVNQEFDSSLCMVGPDVDGSLKAVRELADTLGITVTFTGKLTKQAWIELSEQYNFFINTTTIDNMPVSVIEAMALGLPVISTDVGGMPYLIDDQKSGILVPNNAVDDMANAITMLYKDDGLRNKIISNARKKAEHFDWNTVKEHWHEVLKDL